MTHGICNMNYPAMRDRGCDCSKQKKWRSLHEELKSLQDGGPVLHPPGPQWNVIPSWPVVAFHNFITPEVTNPVVRGEVISAQDEAEAGLLGYTADEYAKLLVNPWEHLTRADDTIAQKIKSEWENIHGQYKADLEKAQAEGETVHGVEYSDKYVIMDDNGHVIKKYEFDPEPILIGVGADPKAQKPFSVTRRG
jgi:hypothetical protein